MSDLRLPNINRVSLVGRLTADPNLRYTPNGTGVLNFNIACSESYKDNKGEWQKTVSFFRIVVWRQQAENLSNMLSKGMPVYVEGKLESKSWEKDGQKKSIVQVNAFRTQILEKRKSDNDEQEQKAPPPEIEDQDDLPF